MSSNAKIILGALLVIIIIGAGYVLLFRLSTPPADAAVRTTVSEFGQQLQKVSLLAPNAKTIIAQTYAPYVTPTLLTTWENDPSKAPGRETSSPWPDHIDIQSVTKTNETTYTVSGSLILMTSNEVEHGGNAGVVPVTLTLEKGTDGWKISSYTESASKSGNSQSGTPASVSSSKTTAVTQTPSTPAPAAHLSISSISPSSGPVGTHVTLTGTGFTSTSQVVLEGGRGAISNVQVNASGTVLTFTMPDSVGAYCKPAQACPMYALLIRPGLHDIAVRNVNDTTSNAVSFTLTGSDTSPY
jgi:hypothetical protein